MKITLFLQLDLTLNLRKMFFFRFLKIFENGSIKNWISPHPGVRNDNIGNPKTIQKRRCLLSMRTRSISKKNFAWILSKINYVYGISVQNVKVFFRYQFGNIIYKSQIAIQSSQRRPRYPWRCPRVRSRAFPLRWQNTSSLLPFQSSRPHYDDLTSVRRPR